MVSGNNAHEIAKEKSKEKTSPSPSSVVLDELADNSLDFITQLQREGDAEFSFDTLNTVNNGSGLKGLTDTGFDNGSNGIFGANNSSLFNAADDYPSQFNF